jgi:hypothetical protein
MSLTSETTYLTNAAIPAQNGGVPCIIRLKQWIMTVATTV